MKKQIILAVITTLIAFDGISQISKRDTVCLPIEWMKNAINKFEYFKVVEQELFLTKNSLNYSLQLNKLKDSVISVYRTKDSAQFNMLQQYERVVFNFEQSFDNFDKALRKEQKKFRRQRTAKWIAFGGGFIIGAVIIK